jgi:hypothetical protein
MRSLQTFALAILASFALIPALGCASSDEPPHTDGVPGDPTAANGESVEGEAASTEDEVRASCSSPRRYFATFREGSGTCAPIPGRRGQWVPEALFADAPAEVQLTTCAYRWSGEKYSRPDRDAIAAKVGYANGLAAACGSSSEPDVGLLQPIPKLDIFAQAGSVGCDVCGILRKGKIWVILPSEKITQKQFEVRLDNGQSRAFQIEATEARALTIALPPPPAGTHYVSGRVKIY